MGRTIMRDALTGSAVARDGYAYALLDGADHTHAHAPVRSLFFPGCSVVNFAPSLMDRAYATLAEAGEADGISLLCCGKLLAFEPEADTVCPAFEADLCDALAATGTERIIAACPNCAAELRRVVAKDERAAAVEIAALPEVLASCGAAIDGAAAKAFSERNGIPFAGAAPKLAVHDSCPDREAGMFARGTRSLLPAELVVEMEHNRASSRCCGSLAKAAGKTEAAARQAEQRGAEGASAGADAIVTACMSCASQLSSFQTELPVIHYLELLYGERIDWAALPPYLQVRFLFETHSGRRDFCGLTGAADDPRKGCCGAAGSAGNAADPADER